MGNNQNLPMNLKYGNLDTAKIIMDTLETEIRNIMNHDPDTYSKYDIILTMERQFIKSKDKKPNTVFIVVKMLQGNRDHGQLVQPITLNSISEHNAIDVCQKLMMDLAETYNLMKFDKTDEEKNVGYCVRQTFTTVSAINMFNEAYDGYRSTFYISGSFLIGYNSNPITSLTINNEDIDFLNASFAYDAQPDSQPFYGTNNFNRTVAKIATLAISFGMYVTDTAFCNKILDVAFNKDGTANINETFTVKVSFKNGRQYTVPMKLAHSSGVQQIRDFPAFQISLMR